MNTQLSLDTSVVTDADFLEAHNYFNAIDSAELIDDLGIVYFLRDVVPLMNNPMQQHMTTQLLLLAEKYEHVLLKTHRADEVLYEVNRNV